RPRGHNILKEKAVCYIAGPKNRDNVVCCDCEFRLKRFGSSTGGLTGMTSQLDACSHGIRSGRRPRASAALRNAMPRKVNFSVVQVSGEDENFQAVELNLHGPTVKGWLSKKYSTYPQEIVIQLETKCRICRIQILSHQYCIATTIDIYVGNVPKGLEVAPYNARWIHLG
ncbi:hypothetical protein HPB47_012127, partial [Ixodes persulcatus]